MRRSTEFGANSSHFYQTTNRAYEARKHGRALRCRIQSEVATFYILKVLSFKQSYYPTESFGKGLDS